MTLWYVSFSLLTLLVFLEGIALLGIARAVGVLQLRLGGEPAALQTADGPQLETHLPVVAGVDVDTDEPVEFPTTTGRWCLLFVGATCGICRGLVYDAGRLPLKQWGIHMVVVCDGSREQNLLFRRLAPKLQMLNDEDRSIHTTFGVMRTPFGLLIEQGLVVAKGVVNNRDHLESLLDGQTTRRSDRAWASIEVQADRVPPVTSERG